MVRYSVNMQFWPDFLAFQSNFSTEIAIFAIFLFLPKLEIPLRSYTLSTFLSPSQSVSPPPARPPASFGYSQMISIEKTFPRLRESQHCTAPACLAARVSRNLAAGRSCFFGYQCTEMQENTWATLRESRGLQGVSHAT